MANLVHGINSNVQVIIGEAVFTTGSLNQDIVFNCDFIPDVIILKQVSAYIDETTTDFGLYKIKSTLTNGDTIIIPITLNYDGAGNVVASSITQNYDIMFLNKSKRPIFGNSQFQLSALDGTVNPNIICQVAFTFEFIKY